MNRYIAVFALGLASCSFLGLSGGLPTLWNTPQSVRSVTSASTGSLLDGVLFVSRSPGLVALRTSTGTPLWSAALQSDCRIPGTSGSRVFCADRTLKAYDAATGTVLWTHADLSDSTFSQVDATVSAERVFAGTLRTVSAVDAQTGQLWWRNGYESLGPLTRIRSLTLSPEGDLLVAIEARQDGNRSAAVIVALDPATGDERWRFRDDGPDGRSMIGGISFFENLLLYSDASGGQVVAVRRDTREVAWRAPGGGILSFRPPDILDGVAYWHSGDSHLYAADARTGTVLWRESPRRGSFVNHAACGRYVFGASIHDLWAVRRNDGATVGRLVSGPEVGQLTVAGDVLYVSTTEGVTAYDCR